MKLSLKPVIYAIHFLLVGIVIFFRFCLLWFHRLDL